MKKTIITSQVLGACLMILTVWPLQVHAMGWLFPKGGAGSGYSDSGGTGGSGSGGSGGSGRIAGNNRGGGNGYSVPEPGTLALLGTGIGGALMYALRRRNRDK